MTRAIDRLIVSGSIDPSAPATPRRRSAGCSSGSTRTELERAGDAPLEIDRDDARCSSCGSTASGRGGPPPAERAGRRGRASSSLFARRRGRPAAFEAPPLPELEPVPAPPPETAYAACPSARSALFERCSYRYYAERVAGMRPRAARPAAREPALAATEVGDAVHVLLERVDLARPGVPDDVERPCGPGIPARPTRSWSGSAGWPRRTARRSSRRRIAALPGARRERPFAFEHDGVLFHGRLDVLLVGAGRALVVDYKTNMLDGARSGGRRRAEYHAPAARLRARVPARRRGRGRGRLPVPRAAGRRRCRALTPVTICRGSRPSCPRRSRGSRPGSSARARRDGLLGLPGAGRRLRGAGVAQLHERARPRASRGVAARPPAR